MPSIDRRLFLGTTAGLATGLRSSTKLHSQEVLQDIPAPPRVPLGKTGIQLSRVGQGTGMRGWNRQSDQTKLGYKKLVDLFVHAYRRGITFFDLADLYGSHVYFREALRTIPREEIAILTKIWWRYDGPETDAPLPWRKEAAETTLERFLHELGTDYIDIVLLHCMQSGDWNQQLKRYMEMLDNAKTAGQVRAVGVSCHNYEALQTAAVSPWVDVILARLNPKGVKMDGTQDEILGVLTKARQNGKAIIGMKIFGEGKLVDQRNTCIKFAQESGVLDTMTIGFDAPEQIDEVLQLLHRHPANPLT